MVPLPGAPCPSCPRYVDNWRPASERREVRDVRDGLPQEDGKGGGQGDEGTRADNKMRNIKLVCLKIGYTPNYSHLIGIMIINHWV